MQHNHAQHNSTITNKILYHCAVKCCYAVFYERFDRKETSNSVARTYIKSLGYNNPWNSYWKGRLSTVDLLIKISYVVNEKIIVSLWKEKQLILTS